MYNYINDLFFKVIEIIKLGVIKEITPINISQF